MISIFKLNSNSASIGTSLEGAEFCVYYDIVDRIPGRIGAG
jgi:hypothetical protein